MCGLYRPEDIDYANEVQPDYVGFVFYEKSHRAVTKEQAAEYRKKLLPGIRTVGVFVNEDPKNIIELLEEGILDVAHRLQILDILLRLISVELCHVQNAFLQQFYDGLRILIHEYPNCPDSRFRI